MNAMTRSPLRKRRTRFVFLALVMLGCVQHGCLANGLNSDFNLNLWKDSSLWDDEAWATANRLKLKGTKGRDGNETFRGQFSGTSQSLGQPLFAIDLYPLNGKVNRVILGFMNEADLAHVAGPGAVKDFDRLRKDCFDGLRTALIKRIGRPSGEGNSLYWTWMNHTFNLQDTGKAVLIDITPGTYSPTAAPNSSVIADPLRAATSPIKYVSRNDSGDVWVSKIPKISQGDRGYCVPATWEKYLRHYGLGFNVYELAEQGGTEVTGSLFTRFTSGMTALLRPHNYKVQHLRFGPDDLKSVSSYIDKGLPLIWHMDAKRLPDWVRRNRSRREKLPSGSEITDFSGPIAGHALLIIGYNIRHREIALSDSTDLGSSEDAIWIHASEAAAAHQSRAEMLAIIPPGRAGGSGGHLKARWY